MLKFVLSVLCLRSKKIQSTLLSVLIKELLEHLHSAVTQLFNLSSRHHPKSISVLTTL